MFERLWWVYKGQVYSKLFCQHRLNSSSTVTRSSYFLLLLFFFRFQSTFFPSSQVFHFIFSFFCCNWIQTTPSLASNLWSLECWALNQVCLQNYMCICTRICILLSVYLDRLLRLVGSIYASQSYVCPRFSNKESKFLWARESASWATKFSQSFYRFACATTQRVGDCNRVLLETHKPTTPTSRTFPVKESPYGRPLCVISLLFFSLSLSLLILSYLSFPYPISSNFIKFYCISMAGFYMALSFRNNWMSEETL